MTTDVGLQVSQDLQSILENIKPVPVKDRSLIDQCFARGYSQTVESDDETLSLLKKIASDLVENPSQRTWVFDDCTNDAVWASIFQSQASLGLSNLRFRVVTVKTLERACLQQVWADWHITHGPRGTAQLTQGDVSVVLSDQPKFVAVEEEEDDSIPTIRVMRCAPLACLEGPIQSLVQTERSETTIDVWIRHTDRPSHVPSTGTYVHAANDASVSLLERLTTIEYPDENQKEAAEEVVVDEIVQEALELLVDDEEEVAADVAGDLEPVVEETTDDVVGEDAGDELSVEEVADDGDVEESSIPSLHDEAAVVDETFVTTSEENQDETIDLGIAPIDYMRFEEQLEKDGISSVVAVFDSTLPTPYKPPVPRQVNDIELLVSPLKEILPESTEKENDSPVVENKKNVETDTDTKSHLAPTDVNSLISCGACQSVKTKACYSKAQLRKKSTRRCMECVEVGRFGVTA